MKGGTIFDIIFIGVTLLLVSIIFIFAGHLNSEFLNAFEDVDKVNTTHIQKVEDTFDLMDTGFAVLMVSLAISTIILSFFIRTHPVLFVASLIIFLILIPITMIFTNVFDAIVTQAPLSTEADDWPVVVHIMRNLPLILAVIGAMSLVALYAFKGNISGES